MTCNNCGKQLKDNSTFCTHCGAKSSDIVLPELRSGSEEMGLEKFGTAQVEPYIPSPAPVAQPEPEKVKAPKKSINKTTLLLIVAAVALTVAAVLGILVIKKSSDRSVPALNDSVDYSQAVDADETVAAGSTERAVRQFLSALQSGDMDAVAAMYNSSYCAYRGYDRRQFAESITPAEYIGAAISSYEIRSCDSISDYARELGLSDVRLATVYLTADGNDDTLYIYLVKEKGDWSVLYPSRVKLD